MWSAQFNTGAVDCIMAGLDDFLHEAFEERKIWKKKKLNWLLHKLKLAYVQVKNRIWRSNTRGASTN